MNLDHELLGAQKTWAMNKPSLGLSFFQIKTRMKMSEVDRAISVQEGLKARRHGMRDNLSTTYEIAQIPKAWSVLRLKLELPWVIKKPFSKVALN